MTEGHGKSNIAPLFQSGAINITIPTFLTFFLQNNAEHEIYPANKSKIPKMAGILMIVSRMNFIIKCVEHSKNVYYLWARKDFYSFLEGG